MVHDLFEEQTSVEAVVSKIMQRAQTLLNCERCVVVLNKHPTHIPPPAAAGSDLSSPSLVRIHLIPYPFLYFFVVVDFLFPVFVAVL